MSTEQQQSASDNDSTDTDRSPVDIVDWTDRVANALDEWNSEDEGSHTELHPDVFHPSALGYCKRQMVLKKLALEDLSDIYGIFYTGEQIHQFMEDYVCASDARLRAEEEIQFEEDGITVVGQFDAYDETNDVVYDFKSRGSWYNYDPPKSSHVDQLHAYMRALDADYGQVVYVNRTDMEVRTWPDGAPFTFDEDRWQQILQRAKDVRDALYEHGFPRSESEIPFEKCGGDDEQACFPCRSETLDFTKFQ